MSKKKIIIYASVPESTDLYALAKSMENNWDIKISSIKPKETPKSAGFYRAMDIAPGEVLENRN